MSDTINAKRGGAEICRQFLAAMQTRDLTPSKGKPLVSDGTWHRCNATNKPDGNNDGSYKLCLDGPVPWGLYRNWTDGKGVDQWRGELNRALTDVEQKELERRIEQQQIEHEKEAADRAAEARDKAQAIWARSKEAPAKHPYLRRKKIQAHGLRVNDDGRLLVPMYDPDGELVNLQFISPDGSKWFLKGGRVKGCYFRIHGKLGPVVLAEGFATGASINESIGCWVAVAFSAGNLAAVGTMIRGELNSTESTLWKAREEVAEAEGLEHEHRSTIVDVEVVIATDDDWKTKDNPGLMAALKAARAARARIAVPTFVVEEREDGDTDFNDVACLYGEKAVVDDIAAAVEPDTLLKEWLLGDPHLAHSPAVVKELAGLQQNDPARYEELLADLRKEKVRVAVLDREVKAVIKAAVTQSDPQTVAELYPHWSADPWPEPVDTADLLEEITEVIKRYAATLGNRSIVVALWVMFTYVHDLAIHSPLLLATSPEPDSGKSTLLGVIGFLARRTLLSVSISSAALYRSLTKWQPTLIVDEADLAFEDNPDLRAVVNSGWTRNQGVIRCEPETNEPRLHSTFAPKAIGMKGKRLPDTTLSRAIIIEMKRKQPGEVVQDFDHVDNDDLKALRRKLVRWAADEAAGLGKAKPKTPPGFHNRTRMNWRLLLAIAELAGDDTAERARRAAQLIEGNKDKSQTSLGVTMLADLSGLFERQFPEPTPTDGILSRVIVEKLVADPEKPWAAYGRDKPLTQRQLANLLAEFGIRSGEVYPDDDDHGKGYKRWQFEEAWARYRPATAEDTDTVTDSDESDNPASEPRKRVNPSARGTCPPFRTAYELRSTRIDDDDMSYIRRDLRGYADWNRAKDQEENSPKSGFRYRHPDIAARQARARRAMEDSSDRHEPSKPTSTGAEKPPMSRKSRPVPTGD